MFMSIHALAASTAALLIAFAPLAQSQSASAPAVPAVAAPSAAPVAAPSATAAPTPKAADVSSADGKVAHYGSKFAGRKTASGEHFNPGALTMAHKTLPFGTMVRVTNVKNSKSVLVRVNDRGPSTPDRVGDLSTAAARKIGMLRSGVVDAKLEVVTAAKARKAKAA